jgi:hypothetical protein
MTALQVRVMPTAGPEPHQLLAGLPESFVLAQDLADVACIGGDTSWPELATAQLLAGRRGVIVFAPQVVTLPAIDRVRRLAADRNAAVVLAHGWASNVAVDGFRRAVSSTSPGPAVVECVATAPPHVSPAALALEQLALLAAAFGVPVDVGRVTGDAWSWTVLAALALDGGEVIAVGTAARMHDAEEGAWVRLSRRGERLSLTVPAGRLARPGVVVVGDAAGDRHLPTIYEPAHRTALLRLHRQVSAGVHDPTDLDRFAAVLPGVRRVLAEAGTA